METTDAEKENLYNDSIKAARIYELILDNNINFDKIQESQVEMENLNNHSKDKFIEYLQDILFKKKDTKGKIDILTSNIKNIIYLLLSEIYLELYDSNEIKTIDNLWKLVSFYYLFKIQTAKDTNDEKHYMAKIDEIVSKILLDKENYYNILIHIKEFNENIFEDNQDAKIKGYFKIITFLDEKLFLQQLAKFIDGKKSKYPQYDIKLPEISFKNKTLCANIKKLYNILYILQRTESFKTNERFEYYQVFQTKPELLNDVNYILCGMEKEPIAAFDTCSKDITQEAIDFSLNYLSKKAKENEEVIAEYSRVTEESAKIQETYQKENLRLKGEISDITSEFNKLKIKYEQAIDDYNNLNNNYGKELEALRNKMKEMKVIQVKTNEEKNKQEFANQLLEIELKKKENIIERISYREVGSRIIHFFSLSQPEDKIKECEDKNISPRNINTIIAYIKKYRSNYFNYLRSLGADLTFTLREIKDEKKSYDSLVHDNKKELKKYIELLNERSKDLGNQISIIFNNSKLMEDYVFDNNNKIKEIEIYEEFQQKEEEFKKMNEGKKKKLGEH